MSETPNQVMQVKNLEVFFTTPEGEVKAVDNVSLSLSPGEILGVVGESGCGKSVTFQATMRLFNEEGQVRYGGSVMVNGVDVLDIPFKQMQKIRGRNLSMIFQDPSSSLNPVYTIGHQLIQTIRTHKAISKPEARDQAVKLLSLTGIPSPVERLNSYPHELSGGMKQRVMISLALASSPQVLIADEPTTALDVTIQSQILELLRSIKDETGMAIIMITHDLGVVAETCSRVAVMYLGQIVEEASVIDIFENPLHPYTQGLLRALPSFVGDRESDLYVIPGVVPALTAIPPGCRFASRCPHADHMCKSQPPTITSLEGGRSIRCWHYQRIASLGGASNGH
jgi:peptide/nickel transport system ATP-binding protein